jgi:hypothetical protein
MEFRIENRIPDRLESVAEFFNIREDYNLEPTSPSEFSGPFCAGQQASRQRRRELENGTPIASGWLREFVIVANAAGEHCSYS